MRSMMLCATALAVSMTLTAAAHAQTVLRLGHVGEVGSHFDVAGHEFAKRVKEKSGGKVEVQVFPSSQLGNDKDMLQKMKLGQVDFFIPSSIMSSVTPEFGVFDMPYIIKDREHAARVMAKMGDSVFRPAAEAKGVKILGFWENGFRQITNNVRPIVKPEDLKGVKLRTPRGEWRVKMFQSYGANPSPMAFSEVFTALKTGVMDGQENPLINVWSAKFYEVQKYLSMTGHVYIPAYLVTSPKTFDKWSADVQKVIAETAVEMEPFAREAGKKFDDDLLDKLKAKGMAVNEADKEAFVAASKGIYDEFGTSVEGGKALIDQISALRN
ncbi:C4-dicarboxylate ABC transporter substrate-binding protein [Thalassobaculum fulvum]|uniref:C4-dicarboxylate ABC transporter substrate-binding protein n=1 Tax=Thalassobaculum fulvum TaxID=1633335 RepID=A0A918XSD3_9PROT|nr:TRAP transporter substrate-binding protein [Thalassobaculum fulvum]GHD51817.1 C4-dicarboxylate ABC transporter substrate-binding protein [Thalassobaculum fulvum]